MKTWNFNYRFLLFFLLIIPLLYIPKVSAAPSMMVIAQTDGDAAVSKGLDYLHSQMNEDGGIRWFDETSSVAATIRVVQALAANDYSQDTLISDSGHRPIDFLEEKALAWINQEETELPEFSVARAGQLLTAIAAANENPYAFGDEQSNLIYSLNLYYDPSTAIYGQATPDNVLDQVWAILGLSANNANVPTDAVNWLESAQLEDGSWNDGYGSYLDTTPLAILALLGSNHTKPQSPSIQSAVNFLQRNQQDNGGWQSEWDSNINPNTTGVILQVISLLGQKPTDETWQKPDGNPLTALIATQQEDGVFGGDFGNAYSTADAIIGLSGTDITSLGFLQSSSKAFDFLVAEQEPDGGWGSVGLTFDVMLAMQAAGWQPNSVNVKGATPLGSVSANIASYLEVGPDAIGKTIIALSAADMNPMQFNGMDLSQRLMETFNETNLAFGDAENTWHQAFAILGLSSIGQDIPQGAIDTLMDLQKEDGGWEYATGFGTWPDNTALAIQALIATGIPQEDETILKALDYLKATQSTDGGWGDSSTTSFVIMALNTLDQPIESWKTETGKDPLIALFSYQKSNGAFVYNWEFPDDNLMSTGTALLAIFGGSYVQSIPDVASINKAAIVVNPGDGKIYADCVEFEGASISGLELIQLSGFDYDNAEGFISSIMGVSNHEGETNYWSYWSWDGREWIFNNAGAADTRIFPGSVEGWYFTSWEVFPSLPMRFVPDIHQICDGQILKNFTAQPHLTYHDLFDTPMVEMENPQSLEGDSSPTSTINSGNQKIQETEKPVTQPTDNQNNLGSENSQSNPAILIIGVVGGIILIIILFLVLQKR